jgi:hypothetical protein
MLTEHGNKMSTRIAELKVNFTVLNADRNSIRVVVFDTKNEVLKAKVQDTRRNVSFQNERIEKKQ